MTEDRNLQEPDLHLPPEVITNASRAVAELYRGSQRIIEFRESVGGSQQLARARIEAERRETWRKTAEVEFPLLKGQIMGLRSALMNGRKPQDKYPWGMVDGFTRLFTRGVSFKNKDAEQFLIDIYFRRISEDGHPELIYNSSDFLLEEANVMRQELGLELGTSNLTLEDAAKAALTGVLGITRQTPEPVKIS